MKSRAKAKTATIRMAERKDDTRAGISLHAFTGRMGETYSGDMGSGDCWSRVASPRCGLLFIFS
jgi:hypothetical protein